MLGRVQHKAERKARQVGLGIAGWILGAVGAGFLTAAAWMTLVTMADAQFAAIVIGCAYVGAGALVLLRAHVIGAQSYEDAHPVPAPHPQPSPDLTGAFMNGFSQGTRVATRNAHTH